MQSITTAILNMSIQWQLHLPAGRIHDCEWIIILCSLLGGYQHLKLNN